MKKWFYFFLKVILVLAVLFFIGLVILSRVGGSSDSLKLSVEEFFRENTGYEAKVTTLNAMNFYPETIIDLEGLNLYESEKTDETPIITVDKVKMNFSFWDVLRATGKIKFFSTEGVYIAPGAIVPESMNLSSLEILDDLPSGTSALKAEGSIGEYPLKAVVSIDREGEGANKKYVLGIVRIFQITLGSAELSGVMTYPKPGQLRLEDLVLRHHGKNAANGALDIILKKPLKISGEIKLNENGTVLQPDLTLNSEMWEGTIKSPYFENDDFVRGSSFNEAIAAIFEMLGYKEADIKIPDHAVKLETDSYNGPLPLQAWHMDMEALTGEKMP